MQCPPNSFQFNTTFCACNPGHLLNTTTSTCSPFSSPDPPLFLSTGVDYESSLGFPETIFALDSIRIFTQSQAWFLEATGVLLLLWLGFCVFVRLFPVADGRSVWFKVRWVISRLDFQFSTKHWDKERQGVVKRKTELGGAFSIASWILFIGLFAALLYQVISNRNIEVHNVRATNEPDLASFSNDLQFNVTTISSMSCAQLRGLGTLVTGNPAFIDQRVVPLSTFANYSCVNTTLGPTITLHCTNCRLIRDFAYVSWQFIDLPGNPATAVGFQFNLTAKNHAREKHLSFVSGTLKNASNFDGRPVTYRGAVPNILKFNFFPRIYHNLHDLKLLQPLFHEFLPGSGSEEISQLRTSLENSSNGVVNTTLFVNFLSSYIVEIDNQDMLGPVSFLADLGGLYCISIGIFLFILVQFEYRIKRLRNEDNVMRTITNRRKARERWQKLRTYVRYTWASSLLDENNRSETEAACCNGVMMKSMHRRSRSKNKRKLPTKTDAINLSIKVAVPNEKKMVPGFLHAQEVRSGFMEPIPNPTKKPSSTIDKQDTVNVEPSFRTHQQGVCQNQGVDVIDMTRIPPLPPYEFGESSEISLNDLQKNLQNLYEYNVMLREKLIETQAIAHIPGGNDPPSMER